MAPSNLDKAVIERDALAATLIWLESKVIVTAPAPPLDEVDVELYIGELNNLKEKVVANYDKIVACAPADMDPHDIGYQRLMDKVMVLLKVLLRAKTAMGKAATASQPPIPTPSSAPQIALPRIDLPQFGGDLHDWMSFKDQFTATIANHTGLSNVQKLTYLRSCLCGDASNILASMDLVDANYDIGWQMLVERYENVREIFYSLLHRFMIHPKVSGGDVPESLHSLANVTKETKRCLKSLKVPVEHWDGILVFLLLRKLDETSRCFWELSLKDTSLPVLDEFLAFVEQRARALAGGIAFKSEEQTSSGQPRKTHVHHAKPAAANPGPSSSNKQKCKFCNQSHANERCTKFIGMSVNERIAAVRSNRLCFTCLKPGHPSLNCKSNLVCSICKRRHNTLLHNEQTPFNGHVANEFAVNQTLLATAQVNVLCKNGNSLICKAFLDGGSTSSFITESCVSRLGLSRKRISADIVGIASCSLGTTKGMVTLSFGPCVSSNHEFSVEAFILPKVTGRMPSYPCDARSWPHLNNLQLADPSYDQPSDIDILLGADIFYDLLLNGKRNGPRGAPMALRSKLGWLIAGSTTSQPTTDIMTHHAQHAVVQPSLNDTVQKFWELEAVPETRVYTIEEQSCETHFKDTHSRNPCGRYVVKLPLKTPQVPVGPTHDIAVRRQLQIERRLKSPSEVRSLYYNFMQEYETLGHMKKFTPEEAAHPEQFGFIPHHYVLKDPNQISKFRVVFDGSVKTGSGFSYNDSQMIGPQLQQPLISILMRFRLNPIAFTADISKMFRQFLVTPEHQNQQCIVWRHNPKDPLQYYKLQTVTYGTASGPFLAGRALHQMAYDEGHNLPLAVPVVLNDFYVDDCMSGEKSVSKAQKTILQLIEMTKRACLSLRKWSSNSREVLEVVPPELRETQTVLPLQEDEVVKTLGLYWNTVNDQFSFKVQLPPVSPVCTKRVLLSEISKTFDPLGWLAPVIIRAKILMQDLWQLKLDWDEPLPMAIQEVWSVYRANLPLLENILINRCVIPVAGSNVQLHGFCDASVKAYAAVVYLRTESADGKITVSLLTSKTRVAPTKTISVPRLELCSALLLSTLMKNVKTSLGISFQEIRAWSDSTIVLSWLNSSPHQLEIFEANRVTKIQEELPFHHWGHVRSAENPADCASRGLDPSELISHSLWWNGPAWLRDTVPVPFDPVPLTIPRVHFSCLEKAVLLNAHVRVSDLSLITKYSSMPKLKRVTAWCLRFMFNVRELVKGKKDSTYVPQLASDVLTVPELDRAFKCLIRRVQSTEFAAEYKLLTEKKSIPVKSKLCQFNPFLDDSHIMRVGGRLRHAAVGPDRKNPVLLPRHHHLTRLLIDETHMANLHAGPQLILSILQGQFWIIRAGDAVRQQVKKCVKCTRYSAQTATQMMADLPSARVNPSRPFSKCGVDYAGPFTLRAIPRSKTTYKGYLALFICFVTRAIHLEVVSSLSTDAFILALKRFVARRGKPSDMFSDCGTNFVGADTELAEFIELVKSDSHNQKVKQFLSLDGIQWHFNPAGAPHFGGLWEAGVKSVKHHLRRVVGATRLTFEELTTVVAQIEACLNSRPLTPMSSDPNDLQALTPAHFLIGDSLRAMPEPDLTEIPLNRLSRFQLVQQLTQHFWRRWSNEYLARLQQRPKWLLPRRDIRLDDLVLVKTDGVSPTCWPLARVIKIHPGDDQMVRAVTLRTATGELKRPIVKLCLLPMENTQPDKCNELDVL